jgi:hypothetical protein
VDTKVKNVIPIKDWTKKLKIVSGLFLILALGPACTHQQSVDSGTSKSPAEGSKPWSESMQDLKVVLTDLLPLAASQKSFSDPKNKSTIESALAQLTKESSAISKHANLPSMDPSVRFLSGAFSEDVKRIESSFRIGKIEFARYDVINLTAYCIECHTRDSSGPNFSSEKLTKAIQGMNPLERAEYEIAVRQYDGALKDLKNLIQSNLNEKGNLFLVDKAVRLSLAITVKYLNDPKKALEVIEILESGKSTPYFLKQNAVSWRQTLEQWKQEKPRSKESIATRLVRIQKGLTKASQLDTLSVERGGDIVYLRSLSELHEVLNKNLSKEDLGQALFLTGQAYEAIRDLDFLNLNENYFESCVRLVPHSKWSSKCFKKYEESIYFGYSGSSGVQIPIEEQVKLRELQSLAFPITVQ